MFKQGATPYKATCSTLMRTEEEDVVEQEADLSKDEVHKVRLTKRSPGRKTGTIEEPSKEGGVSIPVRAAQTPPNADIVEKSATMMKGAERRNANRLR